MTQVKYLGWVYGRSVAGIAGSNPAWGKDVCCELFVRWRSLRRADQSSRGFLPYVWCVTV